MTTDIAVSREDLKKRFQETLEKIGKDKELANKVHDRNLLQKIFANNTRDLANISISQNELISELSQEIQDAIGLINQGQLSIEKLVSEIDEFRSGYERTVMNFVEKFKGVFAALLREDKRIKRLEGNVRNIDNRMDSDKSTEACILKIKELARSKEFRTPEDIFENISTEIEEYFSNAPLRNIDKKQILDTVEDAQFSIMQNGKKLRDEIEHLLDKIADETERYMKYKNQLISFIDELVLMKNDIDPNGRYIGDLLKTKKALQESQFDIVLIGEFQGGKSTTFNMLCGGREISPRGLNGGGVKTSSAVITVQNIDGNETKNGLSEWAEIVWLSEEDLKHRIKDVLDIFKEENESSIEDESIPRLLEIAWSRNLEGDNLDKLKIATLQYRILSKGLYEKIVKNTIYPIDNFQHLVKFPEDWEGRWMNRQNAQFNDEEMLFSCLDRVLVRLHAPQLGRLGCRVTDCPGLFVSKWDTDRAMDVMKSSHAIWYLLNGEKQIDEKARGALRLIKDNKWEDKCFFSINVRKSEQASRRILETDQSILKANKFNSETVFLYNAFLSFRAWQLCQMANDMVSSRDLKCLAEEAEDYTEEELSADLIKRIEAMKGLICEQLYPLKLGKLANEIQSPDINVEDCFDKVFKESKVEEIESAIQKMVIVNRAFAILNNQGSRICKNVLQCIEGELIRCEKEASKNDDEAKHEIVDARSKYIEFKQFAEDLFEFLSEDSLDLAMTQEFFDKNSEEIRDTLRERGKEICKKEWHDWKLIDDVNKIVEQKISDEFTSLVKSKLNVFLSPEELQNNHIYMKRMIEPLLAKIERVKRKFEEIQIDNGLFEGMSIDIEIKDVGQESFRGTLSGSIDTPWYSWELAKDIFTLWIRRFFQSPDDRIDKFFDENDPVGKAFDQFKGDDKNRNNIKNYVGQLRRCLEKNCHDALLNVGNQLEENIRQSNERRKGTQEELNRVRENAAKCRKERIEPYLEKIDLFEREITNTYKYK